MKGALRTLHIRCGDDIRNKLAEAGIEGDFLSFADPGWLGPPPASNAWIAARAALIAERTGLSRQKIRADLGDAYCRFNLVAAGLQGEGSVASVESTSTVIADGLDDFADGVFIGGKLTWTGGGNAGLSVEIKEHRLASGHARLVLWQAMPEAISAGDTFTIAAGCDKRFTTCRDRFDNVVNFRGFPHIPGNDFVVASADAGASNDGGSMAG